MLGFFSPSSLISKLMIHIWCAISDSPSLLAIRLVPSFAGANKFPMVAVGANERGVYEAINFTAVGHRSVLDGP